MVPQYMFVHLFLVSITKALRNKLNYTIFPKSVYVCVYVLGRSEVPFGEVFSITGLEIGSIEIDSLI